MSMRSRSGTSLRGGRPQSRSTAVRLVDSARSTRGSWKRTHWSNPSWRSSSMSSRCGPPGEHPREGISDLGRWRRAEVAKLGPTRQTWDLVGRKALGSSNLPLSVLSTPGGGCPCQSDRGRGNVLDEKRPEPPVYVDLKPERAGRRSQVEPIVGLEPAGRLGVLANRLPLVHPSESDPEDPGRPRVQPNPSQVVVERLIVRERRPAVPRKGVAVDHHRPARSDGKRAP